MHADVLIIGSGVAALQLAKKLRQDLNVIVLTKSTVRDGNSYLAQGGIAAAIGENDHPSKHYMDTLEAGRFHNDLDAVMALTSEAPSLIKSLFEDGCMFDMDSRGSMALGREGAHRENRIVHGGGDATGKTVIEFMLSKTSGNIRIIENIHVIDLLVNEEDGSCIGAKGKDAHGKVHRFYSAHVVLASGGCGQIYEYTSNAVTATGDGIALAYRAGAKIADMEFIQFHPTLLYKEGKALGLISEAVRGEGGRLITEDGEPVMEGIHQQEDLAPRHIVSQTIFNLLNEGKSVFLDITAIENFNSRFPTITAICEQSGVDISLGRIPVSPGSHFLMGGILTDLVGRSSIPGLYAIGEAACTGIHGANRLASNSLLEGLFFGKRLAEWINGQPLLTMANPLRSLEQGGEAPVSLPAIGEIKRRMMKNAGIIKTKEGLLKQLAWLKEIQIEKWIKASWDHLSPDEATRACMLIASYLVTVSALKRTESRGGHFREDFPAEKNEWLRKRVIHCLITEKDGKNEQIKAEVAT
ncbi:L-aspartate oxidase [Cytobacillus sp. NCCP-133]|uniref:L-aspartate oxidase n=1 Tax=Cytobacillus sp. NCCP-133 TaxID=766848 RepID=UPI00223030DB|nr:L-aspartate oxidase [Cytobacillus sp. NCCP-133]GLB58351.1 L-aspartate oxidase [Cytobacillus sp. NCCP-133]